MTVTERSAAWYGGLLGAGVVLAHAAPALAAVPALRYRFLPGLAGLGRADHIALTFDDGPDPESTPEFLDLLDGHGLQATFFVVGSQLARFPDLGRRIVAAGHEIALHGWEHRCHLWRGPREVLRDLSRGRDLVLAVTGQQPRWYRPPFGVLTGGTVRACRRLGLTAVLWNCWGRDWTRRATPDSVCRAVTRDLGGGGTILLHDTASSTAAAGSWRSTLGALPDVFRHIDRQGWQVGPLAEHGLVGRQPAAGRLR